MRVGSGGGGCWKRRGTKELQGDIPQERGGRRKSLLREQRSWRCADREGSRERGRRYKVLLEVQKRGPNQREHLQGKKARFAGHVWPRLTHTHMSAVRKQTASCQ